MVKGFSSILAGIAFLPMTVVIFVSSRCIPRLTRRMGAPRLIAIGITLAVAGMIWLSRISVHSSYLFMVSLPLILLGIGC